MKLSTEMLPDRQAIVTVEVDEERMQNAMQRAAQHVSRIRPLPGFRPGKAPYSMVERAVGKDLLVDEAIEELSRSLYSEVLTESNLEPSDQGKLDVVQKDPPIFKYTIPLRPEIKLGDYASIRLTPHPIEVTDEEVNAVLERFQLSQATMVPVTRGVQKRDTVTVDISGGAPDHPPVEEKGVRLAVGDPNQPGLPFEDQLLGMAAGETREVDHTYPEDDPDESLRGKTAHYSVTVHDIKETQLPQLDDEFAKAISQFQTLDQFKGNVREILRKQKEREEADRFAEEVVDAVAEQAQVTFPPVVLEREIEHEVEHLHEDVQRLGLTWEKYIELSAKTEEQVREEIRPRAEKQLKRILVLAEVMNAENPQITREEVNAEIDRRVKQTEEAGGNPNTARRAYNARDARENIEYNLRLGKTIAGLVASAKGETPHGRILTPDMLRGEANPIPSGLITDPSQIRPEDWPKGLERS